MIKTFFLTLTACNTMWGRATSWLFCFPSNEIAVTSLYLVHCSMHKTVSRRDVHYCETNINTLLCHVLQGTMNKNTQVSQIHVTSEQYADTVEADSKKTYLPSYLQRMFNVPTKLHAKRSYCACKNHHRNIKATELHISIHHKYQKYKKASNMWQRKVQPTNAQGNKKQPL